MPANHPNSPLNPTPASRPGAPAQTSERGASPLPTGQDKGKAQFTRRIASLKIDANQCTVTTGIPTGMTALTFTLSVDAPAFNAVYSLLLAASMNGYLVDFVGVRPLSGAPDVYRLESAEIQWSDAATVWKELPNPKA